VADPPPLNVTAVAGDGEATVSWDAPLGAPPGRVSSYDVGIYVGPSLQGVAHFDSTETTQTIGGLTNMVTYTFYVRALSSHDNESAWSEASNPSRPFEAGNVVLGSLQRPALLDEPASVTDPAPLLVLLHGYGASAAVQNSYLGVTSEASTRGLYVLLPDGTIEQSTGKRFWDAACCAFDSPPVDDVGYLRELIAEAMTVRPIDPDRIYVLGHSNGGAMAYRLACEAADAIAAYASIAGPVVSGYDCEPSQSVSVLNVHGDLDARVFYDGGTIFGDGVGVSPLSPYLSAVDYTAAWAVRDGCDAEPVAGQPIDFDSVLSGDETTVSAYQDCATGVDVQLDTIEGGGHIPAFIKPRVGTHILDWLLDHTR
jgi:polyhydroxybutyrate depolymerase